ncbi:hypothetical protein F5Y15DRAFT_379630 [Xylariaceae sp. FL0016]|nr:hypothetical protein F5Y15DRAFT_379630 [Xylariaceae sp. FL0016]
MSQGVFLPCFCDAGFILGLPTALCVVAIACVSCRLYTRFLVLRTPGWDDLFVFLYILTAIYAVVAIWDLQRHGLGTAEPVFDEIYARASYVSYGAYVLGAWFVKTSLLLQYLRIFKNGKTRRACIVTLVLVSVWGIAFAIVAFFPCWPPRAYWSFTMRTERVQCWGIGAHNPNIMYTTILCQAFGNALLDLVVLGLPFLAFISQKLTGRVRIGIIALFCGGIFANIFATWRVSHIVQAWPGSDKFLHPTCSDSSIEAIVGVIEQNLASIVASIPVFWPELSRRLEEIFVTREVAIIVTERYETRPATRHSSLDFACRNIVSRGRADSDDSRTALKMAASATGTAPRQLPLAHYADDFVIEMVDPLRNKPSFTMDITANKGLKSGSSSKFPPWI